MLGNNENIEGRHGCDTHRSAGEHQQHDRNSLCIEPVLTSHTESAESSILRVVHKNPNGPQRAPLKEKTLRKGFTPQAVALGWPRAV